MKKYAAFALVIVLTLGLFTGCRRNKPEDTTMPSTSAPATQETTAPTTRPTTQPTTQPSTEATDATNGMIDPGMEELLPGTEDTVDPTSGANEDTHARNRSIPKY